MNKIKVLNLYAGIGGNRKLWPNDKIEVTAVEIEPKIAKIYQDFFPNDKVIVADAHQFLLNHFKEFDFIWSSPPCPTHSRMERLHVFGNGYEERYPDMKLYEEIILLKMFFKGKFCVENVISYYEPLIEPQQFDGHYYWCNFLITENSRDRNGFIKNTTLEEKALERDIDLNLLKDVDKTKVLNNMVIPKSGLFIFNMAFNDKQKTLIE